MAETPNSGLDLHDDFDPSQCSMGDEGKQCDACRELEELDTTLRGTCQNLTDPSRKRQALKEKINRLHDPFSRYNLPFELISEIFELFAIDAQSSTSHGRRWLKAEFGAPLLLSAVCRSWREVAFGTPRLWTTMKMILLHTKNIKLQGELIQQWLDRSGQLPLHLLIYDVTYNVTFTDYKLILEAFNAIRSNAFRWRSLTVIAPSSLFPALTQNISSAPSLRSLAFLRHIGRSTYRFCIPDAPSLNEIRILHSHIKDFLLQWNNLTTFHMETVSLDEIFEVLRQADKLEKCTLLHIVDAKEYFALPEAPLVHRSLKDLHLKYGGCFYSKLFPLLVLPSLTQLAIEPGDHFPVDEFISLCRRSNWFLQTFDFQPPLDNFSDAELIRILNHMPSVRFLTLHEADDSECITDRFFERFQGAPAGDEFLPHLGDLEISTCRKISWNVLLEALESLRLRSQAQAIGFMTGPPNVNQIAVRLNLLWSVPDDLLDKDSLLHLTSLVDGNFISVKIVDGHRGTDLIEASSICHGLTPLQPV